MSKLLVSGSLAIIGGSTVAGGVILPRVLQENRWDLPVKMEKFKAHGHNRGCVQDLFPGIEGLEGAKEETETVNAEFIGKVSDGCLAVNWSRKSRTGRESKNETWTGSWRLMLAAKGENGRGLVVFLLGTTSKEKKLKWEGVIYTVKDGGKFWLLKEVKEGDNKSFEKSSSEPNKKFPKAGEILGLGKNVNYWHFLKEEGDLDKICGEQSGCHGSPRAGGELHHWTWTGDEKGAHKFTDWSGEYDTWWKEIFGDDKLKLEEVFKEKKGTWTKADG